VVSGRGVRSLGSGFEGRTLAAGPVVVEVQGGTVVYEPQLSCQTSRFVLRGERSTFCTSASNHRMRAASAGSGRTHGRVERAERRQKKSSARGGVETARSPG
jgi:threonine dehydrogenase-like Zn-dependent dehydrogenase